MIELKNEFDFKLNQPLKYTAEGQNAETMSLILIAPSQKDGRLASKLKQGFMRAVKSLQKDNVQQSQTAETSTSKISASEIVMMLYMSDVDVDEYKEIFNELILNGNCQLDSKQKLTRPLYEKLPTEETDRMLGEYLENFMMSSLLNMATK